MPPPFAPAPLWTPKLLWPGALNLPLCGLLHTFGLEWSLLSRRLVTSECAGMRVHSSGPAYHLNAQALALAAGIAAAPLSLPRTSGYGPELSALALCHTMGQSILLPVLLNAAAQRNMDLIYAPEVRCHCGRGSLALRAQSPSTHPVAQDTEPCLALCSS